MYVSCTSGQQTVRPFRPQGSKFIQGAKMVNTKMATITYGSNYLPQTASIEQVFEQNTMEAPNNNDRGSTVKEGYWQLLCLQLENFTQDPHEVYRVALIHGSSLSLSLPSVPNFSAHPIATPSVLVTHSHLPEDFGLLVSIQPSCNQVDISPSQHLQYMSPHTHTSNCT